MKTVARYGIFAFIGAASSFGGWHIPDWQFWVILAVGNALVWARSWAEGRFK